MGQDKLGNEIIKNLLSTNSIKPNPSLIPNLPTSNSPIGLGNSKYDEGITTQNIGNLNEIRASRQSWFNQLGSMVARGTAKGIISLGYTPAVLGDILKINHTAEDFDNKMVKSLDDAMKSVDEAMPEYSRYLEGSEKFRPWSWDFLMSNFDSVIESAIGFGIPGGIIGGSLTKAGKIFGMSTKLAKTFGAVPTAYIMNHVEGMREATQVYSDMVEQGLSPEDAAKAADEVVWNNKINLMFEIPQTLMLLRGFKHSTSNANIDKSWLRTRGLDLGKQFVPEFLEEVNTGYIVSEAERTALIGKYTKDLANPKLDDFEKIGIQSKLDDLNKNDSKLSRYFDYMLSDQGLTEGFIGGLGGVATDVVGSNAANVFAKIKGQPTENTRKALGKELISKNAETVRTIFNKSSKVYEDMMDAASRNDEEVFNMHRDKLLVNQAYANMNLGTFKQFRDTVESTFDMTEDEAIANDLNHAELQTMKQSTLAKLDKMESIYNKTQNKYEGYSTEVQSKIFETNLSLAFLPEYIKSVGNKINTIYSDAIINGTEYSASHLDLNKTLNLSKIINEKLADASLPTAYKLYLEKQKIKVDALLKNKLDLFNSVIIDTETDSSYYDNSPNKKSSKIEDFEIASIDDSIQDLTSKQLEFEFMNEKTKEQYKELTDTKNLDRLEEQVQAEKEQLVKDARDKAVKQAKDKFSESVSKAKTLAELDNAFKEFRNSKESGFKNLSKKEQAEINKQFSQTRVDFIKNNKSNTTTNTNTNTGSTTNTNTGNDTNNTNTGNKAETSEDQPNKSEEDIDKLNKSQGDDTFKKKSAILSFAWLNVNYTKDTKGVIVDVYDEEGNLQFNPLRDWRLLDYDKLFNGDEIEIFIDTEYATANGIPIDKNNLHRIPYGIRFKGSNLTAAYIHAFTNPITSSIDPTIERFIADKNTHGTQQNLLNKLRNNLFEQLSKNPKDNVISAKISDISKGALALSKDWAPSSTRLAEDTIFGIVNSNGTIDIINSTSEIESKYVTTYNGTEFPIGSVVAMLPSYAKQEQKIILVPSILKTEMLTEEDIDIAIHIIQNFGDYSGQSAKSIFGVIGDDILNNIVFNGKNTTKFKIDKTPDGTRYLYTSKSGSNWNTAVKDLINVNDTAALKAFLQTQRYNVQNKDYIKFKVTKDNDGKITKVEPNGKTPINEWMLTHTSTNINSFNIKDNNGTDTGRKGYFVQPVISFETTSKSSSTSTKSNNTSNNPQVNISDGIREILKDDYRYFEQLLNSEDEQEQSTARGFLEDPKGHLERRMESFTRYAEEAQLQSDEKRRDYYNGIAEEFKKKLSLINDISADAPATGEEVILTPTEEIQNKVAEINKRREEELDNNSGESKIIDTPTQDEQEARSKGEKVLKENKELVEQLEKEVVNEDETLFNELVEKLEELISKEVSGGSFAFKDGKIFLTLNKVQKGNTINSNYTRSTEGQIGKFEIGDNVQVSNGSVAIPGTVTKVSPTGRIIEAQDKNGTILIRNGMVLGSNAIQAEKKINAKYDAEIAALEATTINIEKRSQSSIDTINRIQKILDEGLFTVEDSNHIIRLDKNGNVINHGYRNKDHIYTPDNQAILSSTHVKNVKKQYDYFKIQIEFLNRDYIITLEKLYNLIGRSKLESFLETFPRENRGTASLVNLTDYLLNNATRLENISKQINAKYNAEIAKLEATTPQTETSAKPPRTEQLIDETLLSIDEVLDGDIIGNTNAQPNISISEETQKLLDVKTQIQDNRPVDKLFTNAVNILLNTTDIERYDQITHGGKIKDYYSNEIDKKIAKLKNDNTHNLNSELTNVNPATAAEVSRIATAENKYQAVGEIVLQSNDEELNSIMFKVFDALNGKEPRISFHFENNNNVARYDGSIHTVSINKATVAKSKRALAYVLAHELIHAATVNKLKVSSNRVKFQPLFDIAKSKLGLNPKYRRAFKNIEEFVAEAFSNTEFKKDLQSIKVDNRNWFTKFIDFIKGLFGYTADTTFLYDLVYKNTEELLASSESEFSEDSFDLYDNFLVPGLTVYQTEEMLKTISYIRIQVLRKNKNTTEKDLDLIVKNEINKAYNKLLKNNSVDIKLDLFDVIIGTSQNEEDKFNNDTYKKLTERSKAYIKRMSDYIREDNRVWDETTDEKATDVDKLNDDENTTSESKERVYDKSPFEDNPKDSASKRLKSYLATQPKVAFTPNKENIYIVGNMYNMASTIPFDVLYNTLVDNLANTPIDKIFDKLELLSKYNPQIKKIYNELKQFRESGDLDKVAIYKEFISNFSGQKVKFITSQFTKFGANNSYRVIYSNRNNSQNILIDQWHNNFKYNTNDITKVVKGETVVDKQKAEALYKEFKDYITFNKDTKVTEANKIVKAIELLNRIGISLSSDEISSMLTTDPTLVEKDYTVKKFLNSAEYIIKSLSSKQIITDEDSDLQRLNDNPFIGAESKNLLSLAKIELTVSNNLFSTMFRNEQGKSISSNFKNNVISKIFQEMFDTTSTIYKNMEKSAFHSNSWIFNQIKKGLVTANNFEIDVFSTINERYKAKGVAKTFKEMTAKERLINKIIMYTNEGQSKAYYQFPTLSDKTWVPILGMNRVEVNVANGKVNNEVLEAFYSIFSQEMYRIIDVKDFYANNERFKMIENYHVSYDKELKKEVLGFGGKFIFLPTFNSDNVTVTIGTGDVQVERPINDLNANEFELEEVKAQILDKLNGEVLELIEKEREDLVKNGILHENGVLLVKDKSISKGANKDHFGTNFVANYAVNYALAYNSIYTLFNNDPAFAKDWSDIIKRGAMNSAPGSDLTNNGTFGAAIIKDKKTNSTALKELIEVLPSLTDTKTADKITSALTDIEYTDAQAWCSLKHYRSFLSGLGRLTDRVDKIITALEKDQTITSEDISELMKPLYDNNFVLQPQKPVYVYDTWDPVSNTLVRRYLKYSVFPLFKQLTKDHPELDALRKKIDAPNSRIELVIAKSAVKEGAQFVTEAEDISNDTIIDIPWKGLSLQQETPYDKNKMKINTVSQARKLLFGDLLEFNLAFKFNGNTYQTKELKSIFDSLFKASIKEEYEKLLSDLKINEDGNITDLTLIRDLLAEEGIRKDYDQNFLESLKVENNKFNIPLWISTYSDQIESLLTSIITNRIVKQKMPGRSFVQGSPFGFSKENIVSTSSKRAMAALKGMGISNDKVTDEGIYLPNIFDGLEGFKTGDILTEEMLKVVGFRIPNQGHNSMANLKIAGFLPKEVGDLVIVSPDMLVRMGSDFDVDKLYLYIKNAKRVYKEGRYYITPYTYNDNENEVDVRYKDYLEEAKGKILSFEEFSQLSIERQNSKKARQNAIIDIYMEILSKKELAPRIMRPNDIKELEEANNKVLELQGKNQNPDLNLLSPSAQDEMFESNIAGKTAVGTTSLWSTFLAQIQYYENFGIRIYKQLKDGKVLVNEGVKFKDDKGNLYNDGLVLYKDSSGNVFTEKQAKEVDYKNLVQLENIGLHKVNKVKGVVNNSFISDIIQILQSAAVDNSKEQQMTKGHINDMTLNPAMFMAMSGVDSLPMIISFIAQPSIVKYVKSVQASNSITATFTSEKAEDTEYLKIVKDIQERIGKLGGTFTPLANEWSVSAFSLKELEDALVDNKNFTNENFNNQQKVVYLQRQYEILHAFKYYSGLAQNMNSIINNMNVDTKSIGKNFIEVSAKNDKIQLDILGNSNFIGVDKLWKDTIPGMIYELAIAKSLSIYNDPNLYPTLNFIKFAVDKLKAFKGLKSSDSLSNKDLEGIKRAANHFVTNTINGLFSEESVTQTRNRLINGNDTIKPLHERLLEYQKESFVSNWLLQVLSVDPNTNAISYPSVKIEGDDTVYAIASLVELLNSDDPNVKVFAEDLIKYSFLTSGNNKSKGGLSNIIPIEYLLEKQFGEYYNNDMFIKSLNNPDISNRFLDQYVRNNPTAAFRLDNVIFSNVNGVLKIEENILLKKAGHMPKYVYVFNKDKKGEVTLFGLIGTEDVGKITEVNYQALNRLNSEYSLAEDLMLSVYKNNNKFDPFLISDSITLSDNKDDTMIVSVEPTGEQSNVIIDKSIHEGVEVLRNTNLSIEKSNEFISLIQEQIQNQAYIENKAATANYMFSFGLRWARNIPNIGEKSKQGEFIKARPNRVVINSKEAGTYGYYSTDQNNKPLPSITKVQPIMDFIESNLGIDMSNYDVLLGNIYDDMSFIHQHRDTTESISAEGYPVIVINLGADGNLVFDKSATSTYAEYKKSGELKLTNGSIYAFGVDGKNRFTFHHRIASGLDSTTPTKPIIMPDGTTLNKYRITLTFRRAQDLTTGMPKIPARNVNKNTITKSATEQLDLFSEPIEETTPIISNTNTNTGEITYNPQQQNAIEKVFDFIDNGNPNEYFVIEGKAGTGKTTIAQEIAKKYKYKNISVAALSHKAKNVIKTTFDKANLSADFNSLASLLGMKLDMETGIFRKENKKGFEIDPPITNADIIIIDEASMINEEAINLIFEYKDPKAKVIFLGDIGQLPPIRSENNPYYSNKKELINKKSSVFNTTNKAVLTERVRQGEESPILPFADYFWENSQSKKPVENPITERTNIITKKGALLFSNSFNEIKNNVLDSFKNAVTNKNPNHIKVVTYRNATRETINKWIHDNLFGQSSKDFNEGELIIFNDSYDDIENSTETQVTKASEVFTDKDGLTFINISAVVNDKLQTFPVITNKDKVKYSSLISEMFKDAFALPKGTYEYKVALANAWAFKNKYANVDYGYAITSHKSQGSTYDIVVVNEKDIMGVTATTNENKSESVYTALTRARNISYVISTVKTEAADINIEELNTTINANKKGTVSNTTESPTVTPTTKKPGGLAGMALSKKQAGELSNTTPTEPVVKKSLVSSALRRDQISSEDLNNKDRTIKVEQFNITIKPDGKMFYDNGNEVTDQTTKNKVNVRKELQDGTLRTSTYNGSNYFILSDNRIVGSGTTNLGKESINNVKTKETILATAIKYKPNCK
jgi:hypothetical protein